MLRDQGLKLESMIYCRVSVMDCRPTLEFWGYKVDVYWSLHPHCQWTSDKKPIQVQSKPINLTL